MRSLRSQASQKHSTKSVHTTVVSENIIRARYVYLLKELSSMLFKLHTDALILNYGTRVTTARPADLIRVLSEWSQKDSLDLAIRNIIINAILSAENKQVGAGIICAHLLAHKHKIDKTLVTRNTLMNRADPASIDDTLHYFLGKGLIHRLMSQIIYAGGMSASLNFSFTHVNDFVVQAYTTKEILGEIHPLFDSSDQIQRLDNPVIIAVDGIIEAVGEVDHLLQEIASEKCNSIICARGFGPDVVTTLGKNWRTGTLRVIPFTVREWQVTTSKQSASESDALDACRKMNIKCVSPGSGETLKNTVLDDFTKHEYVLFSRQGAAFQNEAGASQHVEIKVPKRLANLMGVIRDRCKIAQKACIGVARSGICNTSLIEAVADRNGNFKIHVSYTAELVGIRAAESCRAIMGNIGNIILSL